MKTVQNSWKRGLALLLALALTLTLAACGGDSGSSQESAGESSQSGSAQSEESSQAESESGEGSSEEVQEKTIAFQVVHKDGSTQDFEISTTAGTLREALEAEGLIAGEESSYGLYVETVDGETADEGNQEWWCLTKGGEMWNYGVDDTQIQDGDAFEFTLTVGY